MRAAGRHGGQKDRTSEMVEQKGPDADAEVRTVARAIGALGEEVAAERPARRRRRHLEPEGLRRLGEAGFRRTGVPLGEGGLWESVPRTTRPVAELLRTLAGGDPAVALVSAMHAAVLSFWLATPEVGPEA